MIGMTRTRTNVAAAVLSVIALTACTSAARPPVADAPQPTGGAPAAPGAQVGQGLAAAIARARADSARLPYTAADVRFMSAMIGHHSQAIVMARLAPTHGASPAVRTLAERIISAQQDEIAIMQQWLRERQQPVPDPATAGAMMHHPPAAGVAGAPDPHAGHAMPMPAAMPGMLTDAQLKQLDAARGPEFDRLFLTFMIQHHRGATAMVTELFGTYGAAQDETVFKFASDVNVDQQTEIARMQRMLLALELGIDVP
jgi:uncharacterized protein (DUF305 family)